jgi:hypothetical protein
LFKFLFLIPLYNDWASVYLLIKKINFELKNKNRYASIYIINDKSTEKNKLNLKKFSNINKIYILNLKKNIGSQRCVYLGLQYFLDFKNDYIVTVMDADGEDDPKQINNMINLSLNHKEFVITSNRLRRNENLFFLIFYKIHLILTLILTGKWVSFGNFTTFQSQNIKTFLKKNHTFLSYSGSVMKYAKMIKVFADRKKRYFGRSHLNFFQLILHSLRIISVFQKEVLIRSIFFFLALILLDYFFLLNEFILKIIITLILFLNFIILLIFAYHKIKQKSLTIKLIENVKIINVNS